MANAWQPLMDHLTLAVSGTIALLVMAALVALWERAGLSEWAQVARRLWRSIQSGDTAGPPAPVNVEILDKSGQPLDPGPYVTMKMRNTTGKTYTAVGGVFLECNPLWIKPGTLVHLNVQDGKVREELVVMYDPERKTLYLQSSFTTAEILDKIYTAPAAAVRPAA